MNTRGTNMQNKPIRILFIDPQEMEYVLVADLLAHIRDVDYELVWHDQLEGALSLLLSQRFDIALLDYYWPTENARELLYGARVQACQTPIIVMTDERETEVDREAIRAGAADYLIKGQIDSQLLERTLRYAIERKQTEQHLSRLAHYDPLTDIPNRILFRDRLEHAIKLAERETAQFTLMFIDLNGFKAVNDNFGHDAGDQLIRICAERLSECLRRSDTVARMGGDEFTLLLQHIAHEKDIALIAEKVIAALSQPARINGYEVVIGASIGIASYPEAGRDADTLLKNADTAMYRAKQSNVSNYRFFTESMHQDVRRQLRLESDLRAALQLEQFQLRYSPRVDLKTQRVVALDALLYWNKPDVGLLCAEDFLATAEETGLITAIGYWVIRQACNDIKMLHQYLPEPIAVCVNLSMRQFRDDNLVHEVAKLFSEFHVQPGDVEFEMTESMFAENAELIALCMRPLAFFGINFSINNFGVGNSTLLNLQRLPISSVKIDLHFLQELNRSVTDQRLVSALITLAQNLGKWVVAAGVETAEQRQWLIDKGCDFLQGPLITEPLPFSEIAAWLENGPYYRSTRPTVEDAL